MGKKQQESVDPERVPYVVKRVTIYGPEVVRETVGRSQAKTLADALQSKETDNGVRYEIEPYKDESAPKAPKPKRGHKQTGRK